MKLFIILKEVFAYELQVLATKSILQFSTEQSRQCIHTPENKGLNVVFFFFPHTALLSVVTPVFLTIKVWGSAEWFLVLMVIGNKKKYTSFLSTSITIFRLLYYFCLFFSNDCAVRGIPCLFLNPHKTLIAPLSSHMVHSSRSQVWKCTCYESQKG